jgi:hypothetical protein
MHPTLPATRLELTGRQVGSVAISALLIAWGIDVLTGMKWVLTDVSAYTEAAQRMVAGQPLYPVLADPTTADVYRYAPWFAALWIPFRNVPPEVLYPAWTAVLVLSAAVAVMPLMLTRRLLPMALGWFAFSWLCIGARFGNVEPLLVALLVWGVERRWGPAAIGIAASLKIAPILFAAVYVGRGERRKAAVAVAVAGLLMAPMLLSDLSHYPLEATALLSIRRAFGNVMWALSVAVPLVATLLVARSRWAWTVAGIAVLAAFPQLPLYRVSELTVGADRVAGSISATRDSQ